MICDWVIGKAEDSKAKAVLPRLAQTLNFGVCDFPEGNPSWYLA